MRFLSSLAMASLLALTACGGQSSEEINVQEREGILGQIDRFDPAYDPAVGLFDPDIDKSYNALAPIAVGGNYGDPILEWNQLMLDANAQDHSYVNSDQGGPTRTARAFAIVHIAMYEAANCILKFGSPYLSVAARPDTNVAFAIAAAAHKTLVRLYPRQAARFDYALKAMEQQHPIGPAELRGINLGAFIAHKVLESRAYDGSQIEMKFAGYPRLPGLHQVDPYHPDQGYQDSKWGYVRPFAAGNIANFRMPPPPPLTSIRYRNAYNEVLNYGGDGITTPTRRTPEQTIIGIYWGYDGTPGIGTPPRMYNQIARGIARQRGNSPADNALLFALMNVSMADAGIATWAQKYEYGFWRPIIGIRAGYYDGNPYTRGFPNWRPLGAPATNKRDGNFSPNFPAYGSGHSSFGAAAFRSIANFYGTDLIPFTFISDEYNGRNRDAAGFVRPVIARSFQTLSQATEENGQSRIYLGVHWEFDKTESRIVGTNIADFVAARFFRKIH